MLWAHKKVEWGPSGDIQGESDFQLKARKYFLSKPSLTLGCASGN